ncbi:GD23090 [Drosophila simulans]|uniref:GD23090 n=1 Tax=Drosophila simulans TaxID=7240 RepID=B4Q733_DROSI|nr:GD23090 [Drosophila simulans]
MKLMPQTLHGHVLHETADAKKQQPGQQLVHEAPQWVGAQKERDTKYEVHKHKQRRSRKPQQQE